MKECIGVCDPLCQFHKVSGGCSFKLASKESLLPCEKRCLRCKYLKELVDGHPKCGRNWKKYYEKFDKI